MKVNWELVHKYNQPGPRYTSYPPATRFADGFSTSMLLERLRRNSTESKSKLSLYFHIPFCPSLCWYCGCTTVITTQQGQSAAYLRLLEKEMDLLTQLLNPRREVVQIHFGGGTPTFLLPDELRALGSAIRQRFLLADDVEFGVEIDPRRLTWSHIDALREIGCNRVSLGVQDHNPAVQQAVHRIQPKEVTELAAEWVRAAGIGSVNIDLIYGLPHQTAASFEQTIEEVLDLHPDRLAVFSYAQVPWIKPSQKILQTDALPGPETKLQILQLTIERLTAEGFVYIGMDHFARPDDELAVAQRNKTLQRNFQGYSTCGHTEIYSFGMSSISQAGDAYWQNYKELPAYADALKDRRWPIQRGYLLTSDDVIRRATIMRLMCDLELNYALMSRRLGLEFTSYFARELTSLDDLEADGLVRRTGSELAITETGRLFIRNIAMRFDAYLPAQAERRFSQTV